MSTLVQSGQRGNDAPTSQPANQVAKQVLASLLRKLSVVVAAQKEKNKKTKAVHCILKIWEVGRVVGLWVTDS